MLSNYYGDYSAIYAILVFWSDDSGYGLFQILWILHPRPSSFDGILHQIHIVNASYLTLDTHLCPLQTRLFSAELSCIQFCIKTKRSRRTLVKSDRHYPGRLWLSSSNHYLGYPIKKLTFYYKRRRPITSNWLLNLPTNHGAQRW